MEMFRQEKKDNGLDTRGLGMGGLHNTGWGKKGRFRQYPQPLAQRGWGCAHGARLSLESYLLPCVCPFAACASRRMSDVVDLDWEEQQPQEPTHACWLLAGPSEAVIRRRTMIL
jgi:hypothetical protein